MKVDWAKVEEMVGLPDYAVVFSLWPWPDGGWMAGLCLIDREYAQEQNLPLRICNLEDVGIGGVEWDVIDGFKKGINVHAPSPQEAIDELYSAVR